jgi:outer membrane protein TolC
MRNNQNPRPNPNSPSRRQDAKKTKNRLEKAEFCLSILWFTKVLLPSLKIDLGGSPSFAFSRLRGGFGFLFFSFLLLAGEARAQVLSLGDALRLAEKTSPDLQAQLERETQAQAETGVLTAYYFPTLDLAGVDSTGFPGSGSPTPYGFGGIINSPYRSGLAGDVVGTWTLFDASKGYGLTASRYREMSTREQTRVVRLEVDQTALKLYFDACRYQGLEKAWKGVVDRINPIQDTVRHFVRTGRYNEVQLLLLQDQMDQAQLNVDTYEQQYQMTLKRLGLLLGVDGGSIHVPDYTTLDESGLKVIQEAVSNPYLRFAQDEVQTAKALSSGTTAERLPQLYVSGSVGLMDSSRLVPENDYSGWVGVTVPLFDEVRIGNEEKRTQAALQEKNKQFSATQLQVDDVNAQYDEAIGVARGQIGVLGPQHEAAVRNFALAKDRYLNFLGTVTDLEESVRNVAQIDTEMANAQMDLLTAEGSKSLFNGGTIGEGAGKRGMP